MRAKVVAFAALQVAVRPLFLWYLCHCSLKEKYPQLEGVLFGASCCRLTFHQLVTYSSWRVGSKCAESCLLQRCCPSSFGCRLLAIARQDQLLEGLWLSPPICVPLQAASNIITASMPLALAQHRSLEAPGRFGRLALPCHACGRRLHALSWAPLTFLQCALRNLLECLPILAAIICFDASPCCVPWGAPSRVLLLCR